MRRGYAYCESRIRTKVGDLQRELIACLVAGGENDERLDHRAAALVGRRDCSCLPDGGMLDAGRLDFERPIW